MKTLRGRVEVMEADQQPEGQAELLPMVVPADTTDKELQAARRTGRMVFREGDAALFDASV